MSHRLKKRGKERFGGLGFLPLTGCLTSKSGDKTMSERMLLEALIAHHGIGNIMQMMVIICDAKAAEMAAYAERMTKCERV